MVGIAAQLFGDGLVTASAYALFAVAFALLYRITGFFHFTFASIYAVAAYAAVVAARLSPIASVLCAVSAAVGLALLLHVAIFRRLLVRRSPPLVPMLASIGAVAVLENVFALAFGPGIRVAPSIGAGVITVGVVRITQLRLVQIVVCLSIAAVVVTWLNRSALGAQIRAVASDAELAAIKGLRVRRLTLSVTALAGGIAAIPAVFTAADTGVVPQSGAIPLLMAITAMIVGGLQKSWGWVLGAMAVAFGRQLATLFVSAQWVDAAMFALLCIALLARRHGIATALRARYAA